MILTGAWLGAYWGGFSWTDSRVLFNYHPLFMVLGLVFLYGDGESNGYLVLKDRHKMYVFMFSLILLSQRCSCDVMRNANCVLPFELIQAATNCLLKNDISP